MSLIKTIYKYIMPFEWRFLLYKRRNRSEVRTLRKKVFKSDKGNFSLRHYDTTQSIFVHITKSAGTSVAKALYGELPYHYTAQQYRVIYGRKTFNAYYKFCFVRNPWDRLYSAFSYLKGGGWNDEDRLWANENLSKIESFDDFVMNWFSEDQLKSHIHFWPQSKFICDRHGKPIIDDLYYFETINEDFDTITKKLNINAQLAHTNASKRKSYLDIYTPETIEKVRKIYYQDITNFGYKFNGINRKTIRNKTFVDAR
ncbi:hypothetical protein A3758_09400 [Oleiphilus sp. HI0118]|nr:hypothetical protein A3758_09400 [Oleiphilus sp. HI0118]KZZ80507.1 hypothetical protein A3767_09750 [Oleiphilus sp. HI0133]